jgi:DNA-binding MarR family transcriptional regulator
MSRRHTDPDARRLVAALETVFRRFTAGRQPLLGDEASLSLQDVRTFQRIAQMAPANMTELARALIVPLSTATHSVNRLVGRDLVKRERSERDRRVVTVQLTERGRRLAEMFQQHQLALATVMLGALSVKDRHMFLELVDKIASVAGK